MYACAYVLYKTQKYAITVSKNWQHNENIATKNVVNITNTFIYSLARTNMNE